VGYCRKTGTLEATVPWLFLSSSRATAQEKIDLLEGDKQ
jgi:hypothetical protein